MEQAIRTDKATHRPSVLLEARAAVRAYTDIDADIMRSIAALPEDDNCHSARESLQLGAGFAYLQAKESLMPEPFVSQDSDCFELHPELVTTFFDSRPVNRYTESSERQRYQDRVAWLAMQRICNKPLGENEAWIDPYDIEALVAFVTGYQHVYHAISPY